MEEIYRVGLTADTKIIYLQHNEIQIPRVLYNTVNIPIIASKQAIDWVGFERNPYTRTSIHMSIDQNIKVIL